MSLTPGFRLGPYEVMALIGTGGMGEVYRAHDKSLGRDVALKVLPTAFALDPERVARFRREAQVLAALNHPHIASIYGLEESPAGLGLVLELVEGPTLADRLVHGPMPLDEAGPIARQVAEALEAAHDRGIIHRDLKPANIKVRADGTVKVLDFGLAKAFDPDGTDGVDGATQSPTLTSPAATRAGVILGTAAYMSPEQARGRSVDKRADVWAFGCMLYEMLAGTRPFAGDDVSQTIARVIEREPDWETLSTIAPPPVVRVIRRCLQKDVRQRFRDIGDVRLELLDAVGADERRDAVGAATGVRRSRFSGAVLVAAGLALGVIGTGLVAPLLRGQAPVSTARAPRVSTEIRVPADALLALDATAADVGFDSTLLDLSPDGRQLVWVGSSANGGVRLFARALDSFEIRPLAGTEGALHPFFSPDGRSLGFLTNDKLKIYSFVTGTTTSIADVMTGVAGTWTADDQIFFAAQEGRRLFRVTARGGAPVPVADAREGYRYGRVTPDGKSALVTYRQAGIGADFAEVRLVNLATNDVKTLTTDGYDARLTPGGTLVFGRSGRVFAARFDPERQTVGEPVPIASDVRMHALYPHLQLAVSDNALAYVPGGDVAVASLAWINRKGQAEFLPLEPRAYGTFDLSDDGRRLAIQVGDTKDFILLYDLERGSSRRLPAAESAGWPQWSANGEMLAYTSFAEGKPYRIMVQRVDSDRPPMQVAESPIRLTPSTWSPDGRQLTFYEFPTNRLSVVSVSPEGVAQPRPQEVSFAAATHDRSPDGRWLVYADEGISVRTLAVGEHVQQISDFGTEPKWCRSCNEIVFRSGNRWFSAEVRTGSAFDWKPPRMILQTSFNDSPGPSFGLSPDGQRILVVKRRDERPRDTIRVIHSWLGS
jgi:Tol biopolymer transport system component/tRNA A-37 threonylcarbamoyl transferase component Bud32